MSGTAGASEHVQQPLQVVPATQDSHTVKPAATAASPPLPDGDEFDTVATLVRLIIGVVLEGADELAARLREWDAAARAAAPPGAYREALADPRPAALVGLAFGLQQRVSQGLAALRRRSDEAARTIAARLAPVLRLTPFDPVMGSLNDMYRDWTDRMDRWAALGRIEEQEARLLARKALPGLIDRALDVVTKNPEVRSLLQQQGAEVAKSALDEARERVGGADALAERIARTLLRRPKSGEAALPPPATPAQGDAAGSEEAKRADGAKNAPGAR